MARTVPGWIALSMNSRPKPMSTTMYPVDVACASVVRTSRRTSLRWSRVSAMSRSALTSEPPDRADTSSVETRTETSRDGSRVFFVDRASQEAFARALRTFVASGRTLLLVLHDMGPLAPLVDRCVVLDAGFVAHDGPLPLPSGVAGMPHGHIHAADPGQT